MAKVITFGKQRSVRRSASGLELNELINLLSPFELAPFEYFLMLDLMKKGIPRRALQAYSKLEARHLVYRPSVGRLRLTPAGWAILEACKILGAGGPRPKRIANTRDLRILSAYSPAG